MWGALLLYSALGRLDGKVEGERIKQGATHYLANKGMTSVGQYLDSDAMEWQEVLDTKRKISYWLKREADVGEGRKNQVSFSVVPVANAIGW